MKKIIIVILLTLSLGFACHEEEIKNDLHGFNEFLGKEKADALTNLVESFDRYIETNYPNQKPENLKIKEFIKEFESDFKIDSSWIFETENKEIIELFEKSGMRKEIWAYNYESFEDDSIVVYLTKGYGKYVKDSVECIRIHNESFDSIERIASEKGLKVRRDSNYLDANFMGKYIRGLMKFASEDSTVQGYVHVKEAGGNVPCTVLSAGFLNQDDDFSEPFFKRMIVVELYYPLIKQDIKRKENNNAR